MNCRRFERDLADWIGGRLPEPISRQMLAHTAVCAECSRVAEGERSLRSAWRELPPIGEAPDLWPQLAARISEPRSARPTRSMRPTRPAWLAWLPDLGPSMRYGLAGVAAAMVLTTIIVSRTPGIATGVSHPTVAGIDGGVRTPIQADEHHVVELISDRQATLPEAEGDLRIVGTARYREAERFALGVTSAP